MDIFKFFFKFSWLDSHLGENMMEVVIVEYYGNFDVQSSFLTQESSVPLMEAVFWDNSYLMQFPVPSHVNTFFW